MRLAGLKYPDVSNGPGCRVSVFVSGCRLKCPGCFNSEAQDFQYGEEFTEEHIEDILEKLDYNWVSGLSLLGGDPMEPENQETVLKIILEAKKRQPNKSIWMWTGRKIGQVPFTEYTEDILRNLDIVIDGPFIESLKDLGLEYRGSSNQRILEKPLEVFLKERIQILEEKAS